jgi:hypothetical protein
MLQTLDLTAASRKGMLSQNYLLYYAASCGLFSLRHSHGNDLIAVPAVDFEIGVECNYLCRTVNLGKPDKASVGQ